MNHSRRTWVKLAGLTAGIAATGGTIRWTAASSAPRLRPPGAAEDFLARCIRCQQCVQVCPTNVLLPANSTDGITFATPFLEARQQPCDLCQGRGQMECIAVCPTEALHDITDRRDVRMGLAIIDSDTCLPFVGVSCKACWHACPFPGDAIQFDGLGRPQVVEEDCVGCGLCEHVCLTEPTSIKIIPTKAV